MPNIYSNYHDELTELEAALLKDKTGLRILVDDEGFASLRNDADSQNLIKFSIVCLRDSEKSTVKKHGNKSSFSVINVNDIVKSGNCVNYIENSWQAGPSDDLLYTSLTPAEFNKLSPKVTLLPFPLQHDLYSQLYGSDQLRRFYEKGDDPKTGVNYLQTVNRVISKKIPYSNGDTGPLVSFFGYKNERSFNLNARYYPPQNFKSLGNLMLTNPKLILTGYGMGNDYTAIKVLQNIYNAQPGKKIFEIRVYARTELDKFIKDYETGALNCASVILRDVFDPFMKTYKASGDYNLFGHEFVKEIKKNSEGLEAIDAKSIPAPEIERRILKGGTFEKLFRQKQIFDSFDGTCGNYLIMTSQFDDEDKIKDFYNAVLRDLEIGSLISTCLSEFKVRALEYGDREKTYKLFLNELLFEIEHWVSRELDHESQTKLVNSFNSLITYLQSDEKSEPFRIGMAMVFKRMFFQSLNEFLISKDFEGDHKRTFVDKFVREIKSTREDCGYYFHFLH